MEEEDKEEGRRKNFSSRILSSDHDRLLHRVRIFRRAYKRLRSLHAERASVRPRCVPAAKRSTTPWSHHRYARQYRICHLLVVLLQLPRGRLMLPHREPSR